MSKLVDSWLVNCSSLWSTSSFSVMEANIHLPWVPLGLDYLSQEVRKALIKNN